MKRVKKIIAGIVNNNVLMQKTLKYVLIILFTVLVKMSYDLFLIHQEVNKIQAEREKLELWPFE